MRSMSLIIFLAVSFSLVGVAKAQETTGDTAEKVKKEILELEREKIQAQTSTTSGNNSAAQWLERVDADDIEFIGYDGITKTKAQLLAEFRLGTHKTYSIQQLDVHVRVYGNGGNGTTGVITYLNVVDGDRHGQRSILKDNATDVFVKLDGVWRWVVHHHSLPPIKCAG